MAQPWAQLPPSHIHNNGKDSAGKQICHYSYYSIIVTIKITTTNTVIIVMVSAGEGEAEVNAGSQVL